MRYFFSLTGSEATLAIRIIVSSTACCAVTLGCSIQRIGTGLIGTALLAIDITAVTVATENDLAVAAGTMKQPGAGIHRYKRPMRVGFLPARVRL